MYPFLGLANLHFVMQNMTAYSSVSVTYETSPKYENHVSRLDDPLRTFVSDGFQQVVLSGLQPYTTCELSRTFKIQNQADRAGFKTTTKSATAISTPSELRDALET